MQICLLPWILLNYTPIIPHENFIVAAHFSGFKYSQELVGMLQGSGTRNDRLRLREGKCRLDIREKVQIL